MIREDTGPQRPMQVTQPPALTCCMLSSLSQAVHFPLALAANFFFLERGFIASKTSISSPCSYHTKNRDPVVQHVSRTPRSNTPYRLICPVSSPVDLPLFPASSGQRGRTYLLTFLLGDQVLHNDIGHAIPVGVAVLVEPMDCAENQLVEGNGAILAAHHLRRTSLSVLSPLWRQTCLSGTNVSDLTG